MHQPSMGSRPRGLQQLWCTGLGALRHMESFWARNEPVSLTLAGRFLTTGATRKVLVARISKIVNVDRNSAGQKPPICTHTKREENKLLLGLFNIARLKWSFEHNRKFQDATSKFISKTQLQKGKQMNFALLNYFVKLNKLVEAI